VTGNLIHHVIQKRNAGLEGRPTRAIQIDSNPYPGLGSIALYLGGAGSHAEDSEKSDGASSYNAGKILLSATGKSRAGLWAFPLKLTRVKSRIYDTEEVLHEEVEIHP
jgi:hypothetical protein